MTKTETMRYEVVARSRKGGGAELSAFETTVRFDATSGRDEVHPGPAELLCGALAACLLKNVQRFSEMLPFEYEEAEVTVTGEREAPPPRFTRFHYVIRVATDEPDDRLDLLHKNLRRFGTVTNTLGQSAELEGELVRR